jgi:alcohol dehydrogenase (cytochrome c)
MRTLIVSLLLLASQAPPATLPVVRKTVQTTDGKTITGRVLNEGMSDLQLLTDDQHVHLIRKMDGGRYREVTSQKDWPTYHGDVGGNRYSTLTQIDKTNVGRLAPKWVFPMPNVTTVENTPVVVGGIMYISSANEVWALDAGTGRQVWHFRRPRTNGLSGNAALGFNRGVAISGDRLFMLTDNAHMVAFDRNNGELLWGLLARRQSRPRL